MRRNNLKQEVLAVITRAPATTRQICAIINHSRPSTVIATIRRTPGTYVSGWVLRGAHRSEAVWAYDPYGGMKDAPALKAKQRD